MQAFQIKNGAPIEPLPLLSPFRRGDAPAETYRKQAIGELPRIVPDLKSARFVRTIALKDGDFSGIASDSGALVTFVLSGELTLTTHGDQKTTLSAGDLFLVDEHSASRIGAHARGQCRLVQVGVGADWPDPAATIQPPGTAHPPHPHKCVRVERHDDDLAYFRDFSDLYSTPLNEWSAPRPVTGFRMMSWEDGFIDWHPEVVNNFAMILSGELELKVSGGDQASHIFHAGDVCLAVDRTGVGHIDWCRGYTHVALLVIEDKDLW